MTLKGMRRLISKKKMFWARLLTLIQIRVDSTPCSSRISEIDNLICINTFVFFRKDWKLRNVIKHLSGIGSHPCC